MHVHLQSRKIAGGLWAIAIASALSLAPSAGQAQTPTPLPAPIHLQAEPAAGQVTLSWDGGTSTQFRVYRRLSQCDTYAAVGVTANTSFRDTGVVDGRHYYYYVVALASGIESPPSGAVAVTPGLQPPASPTLNASAGPVDSGRIQLSWTATPTATRYTIRRDLRPSCFFQPVPGTVLATVDAPGTTFTDTTATPGLAYIYSVTALNAGGEGRPSNVVMVLAPSAVPRPTPTPCAQPTPTPSPAPAQAAPLPPVDVATSVSDRRVQITWQGPFEPPNTARRFHVYRATTLCGPYRQIARGSTGRAYTDTGLTNGTTYFYFVVGVNDLGESLDSYVVSAAPDATLPRVPTGMTAVGHQRLDGAYAITVGWNNDFGTDTYTVKRATARTGPYTTIAADVRAASLDHDRASYEDTSAAINTVYHYVVEGVNGAGRGPVSEPVSASIDVSLPAPTGFTATPALGGITLRWDAAPGAVTYRVRRATSRCGTFAAITNVSTTTLFDPVGTNGRFYYVVSSVSGAEEGPRSTIAAAAADIAVPGPVLAVSGGPALLLSWDAVPSSGGYRIERQIPNVPPCAPHRFDVRATVPAETRSFSDGVVSPGSSYFYRVTAVVNGYAGSPSNMAIGRTTGANVFPTPTPGACPTATPTPTPLPPTEPPSAPTEVHLTAGSQQVRLTWAPGRNQRGHNVYRGTAACGPFVLVARRAFGEPFSFTDVGLANGTSYFYMVTATNALGESPESAAIAARPTVLPPPAPSIALALAGDTRLKIQWTPSYTATSYVVRRRNPDGSFGVVGTSTTDSFVDNGLVNGTLYNYRVAAVNAGGEGLFAETFGTPRPEVSTIEVTPPASRVTAGTHDGNVPGNTVDRNLATRWSASGDGAWIQYDLGQVYTVTHVRVAAYRGNERQNRFDLQLAADDVIRTYPQQGSGTTTQEETFDVPDQPARYVRYRGQGAVLNGGGTTPWSSVTEVRIFARATQTPTPTPTATCPTPPPTPTLPPPPANLTATAGIGEITLRWRHTAPEFQILRATTSGGPYVPIDRVMSGVYVDRTAERGVRYFYVVTTYQLVTGGGPPPCPTWSFVVTSPPSNEADAVTTATADVDVTPPGSSVTASTSDTNLPANSVDGNLATRWSGFSDDDDFPAWLRFDLGQARTVTRVRIAFYRGDTRQNLFWLQTSPDDVTWTTQFSGRSSGAGTALETFDVLDSRVRYVRYRGLGFLANEGGGGSWNSLTEVKVLATPD